MPNEAQLQFADSERAVLVDGQIEELQKITDYEIKEWPIGVLVEKFTNGRDSDESEIFIPDYQREMVWTPKQQSRFIESILIKLPVPFIFAADVGEGDREGSLEIIDGSQRIRTLDNFLSNKLELVGLKKLTHAIGMRFSDFSKPRQMRFKRTTVRVIELTEKADEDARREMFDRLNSGGTRLTTMEVRRGVVDGPFMTFITECAADVNFKELVPLDLPPTSRTKLRLVKSVTMEQDGHEEEQIYRRTDHWLSQASRGWHASQGAVPQRWLQ